MTLFRRAPAPYFELSLMLGAGRDPCGKLGARGAAKLQILGEGATSWGVVDRAGIVQACAGLVPLGGGRFEAWFACWPSLARHMRAFARLARLTLAELPQDAVVTARVDPGWRPGEKLALLLGFEPVEPGLWRWRCREFGNADL